MRKTMLGRLGVLPLSSGRICLPMRFGNCTYERARRECTRACNYTCTCTCTIDGKLRRHPNAEHPVLLVPVLLITSAGTSGRPVSAKSYELEGLEATG